MKETIPFSKDIVFKNTIASITSISLEHEEKIYSGEISGEFIIMGDYKSHNDTTERESFKYRLPYNTLIPNDINLDTLKVDIINFTYNQIESDVLHIDIEILIEGEELEKSTIKDIDFESISTLEEPTREKISLNEELDEFISALNEPIPVEDTESREIELPTIEETPISEELVTIEDPENREELILEETQNKEEIKIEEKEESTIKDEYITYHVHTMKAEDTLETIVAKYNGDLDTVKDLNSIKELKAGDKIIIPEYIER